MSKLFILIILSSLSFAGVSQSEFCSDTINTSYFENNDYVERLTVLKQKYEGQTWIGGECLKLMVFDMVDYTGIDASISFGYAGAFYKSKELFLEDIEKWQEYVENHNN